MDPPEPEKYLIMILVIIESLDAGLPGSIKF